MKSIGLSEVGKVRKNNEDNYYLPQDQEKFVLLADGMGGHAAGETASAMAMSVLQEEFSRKSPDEPYGETIRKGIQKANEEIYWKAKKNPELEGMGTTVSILAFDRDLVYFSNVGDSRIYLWENGKLVQLTRDDSFVNYLVSMGEITEEEAKNHPRKNVLTKALGTTKTIEVTISSRPVGNRPWYLMCSDGLTGMVEDNRIAEILGSYPFHEVPGKLVEEAMNNGGVDNITVVLTSLEEEL